MMFMVNFDGIIKEEKEYIDEGKPVVKIFKVSTENAKDFAYKAGQFAMISVDAVKNPTNPALLKQSAMSISSSPHEKGYIEFCIRMAGKPESESVSSWLDNHGKPGTAIHLRAPFGVFTLTDGADEYVFVAAGTGIAPMMGFIRHLNAEKSNKKFRLFFGCRNDNDYLYRQELEKIAKENKNFGLHTIYSRSDKLGKQGHVQELLKDYNFGNNLAKSHAYVCGNPQAVVEMMDVLKQKGFPDKNVHEEKW